MSLDGKRIMIVGGSSGIGLAAALAASRAGADVVIAGRSRERLGAAREQICCKPEVGSGPDVAIAIMDTTNDASVAEVMTAAGPLDHLVITASSVSVGPVRELPLEAAMASMDSKFWGPYRVVRAATMNQTGSIVLVSGVLSRRPRPGLVNLAAINAAVEALGRGLALELSPVRVNVVSPGTTDTPMYESMPEEQRSAFFESVGKNIPVGRIGRPDDIAAAILLLMTNGFITGTVLDVDGGSSLT